MPRPTFESLFAAIHDGAADLILAPIENALAGSVHRSYDLLLESNLTIAGEVVIPIVMNLIGAPGAHWEDVLSAESHPVALAQCERFFAEHPQIRRIVAEDTAGSVNNLCARVMYRGRRLLDCVRRKFMAANFCANILRTTARTLRDSCCFHPTRKLRGAQINFRWCCGWRISRDRCRRRWNLLRSDKLIYCELKAGRFRDIRGSIVSIWTCSVNRRRESEERAGGAAEIWA